MDLILRVALGQRDCQRAREARQLLRSQFDGASPLIYRMVASDGDGTRAEAALTLLATHDEVHSSRQCVASEWRD